MSQDYSIAGTHTRDIEYTWPEGKEMAISLTFDDARFTQIDSAVPLLNKLQVHATFYVNLDRVSKRLNQWQKALEAGHEIGNHSLKHSCTGNFDWSRHKALEKYTLTEMDSQLDSANAILKKMLGIEVYSFAYPCGQTFIGEGTHTRSYVPLVAEKFETGRLWLSEAPNDPVYCNIHQLSGTKLDGLSAEEAIKIIEKARENGDWIVFTSHETVALENPSGLKTPLSTLEAICNYANDPANGIWIDNVHTIAKYVVEKKNELLGHGSNSWSDE